MEAKYVAAFMTGLLGGFGHCIGMCGPIISAYAITSTGLSFNEKLLSHIFYNTGRITTYAFVGFLMGLGGTIINTLHSPVIQRTVELIAGMFMIITGLTVMGMLGRQDWLEGRGDIILKVGKLFITGRSLWRYYLLGTVFGFMPCGLSYSMFVAASASGEAKRGLILMLSFGLGSTPALLLLAHGVALIGTTLRGILYRASGAVIVVMGFMYIKKAVL